MSDPAHKEFFHPNTYKHIDAEELTFSKDVPLSSGVGSVVGELRGIGNFGIVLNGSIDISGYRLEVFTEPSLTNKIFEVTS